MKSRCIFLHTDNICKVKKKIIAALLILAMAVTGIAVSDSPAQAGLQSWPKPVNDYDVYIDCGCPNFNVRDTSGNILFEMVKGKVTQQDMGRAEYIYMSLQDRIEYLEGGATPAGETISPIMDLYIRGCRYFIITCTCENSADAYTSSRDNWYFKIRTSSGTSASYRGIPNMEISVFGNEISIEYPHTKLSWNKVDEAERYAVLTKPYLNGCIWEGGRTFAYTKKTSCTVPDEKGKTYQIWAQKKGKYEWKNIRSFEITIYDDKVSVDSRPTTKLRWNKVKKAERYAILEKRHFENRCSIGGIPFTYTPKTSYKVPDEEGKTYQIWAQKKVKGKWKTIKTIEITL